MSRTKVCKLEVVKCFLEEHPAYRRYACHANAQMIAEAIQGKDRFFDVDDLPTYLPNSIIIEALERVRSRLADLFYEPVQRWLANNTMFNPCDANAQILLRALASENATPQDNLEEMLTGLLHPGHPNSIADSLLLSEKFQVERGREAQRKSLAEKIIANAPPLATGTTDKQAERAKKKAREEWIARIRAMSLEDLKRVREKQQLRQGDQGDTSDGLLDARQIVQNADRERQSELVDRQFQPWPEHGYVPPGKPVECAVPLTVWLFKQLPPSEVSRLFRVFGQKQINEVLAKAQQKK